MRIVLDLQAAQTTSARQDIGRYSLALAQSMVKGAGQNEIILALNSALPGTIEQIRSAFEGLLDQNKIKVWHGLCDIAGHDPSKTWRRQASERIRESFIASLDPDVVHIANLFEGRGEDGATSVGVFCPGLNTVATLFDLIPRIYPGFYLQDAPSTQWYETKISYLQRVNLLFTVSEATRREAIELLGIAPDRIIIISGAAHDRFRPLTIGLGAEKRLRQRYGVSRPFVMYTGTTEYSANVEGLIQAFGLLPESTRRTHQLFLACASPEDERLRLSNLAAAHGLSPDDIIFAESVPDADLVALYNLCRVFCLPSLHEGFSLPLVEAMACGAPVIAADAAGLPEVVGRSDALFPPSDRHALAARLQQVLSDEAFRCDLQSYGPKRAAQFSWDASAGRALEALGTYTKHVSLHQSRTVRSRGSSRPRLIYVSPMPPDRTGIADYSVELLDELSAYYTIDIVCPRRGVKYVAPNDGCNVHTMDWFNRRSAGNDRILYHFGNSAFHLHMFAMLERSPGVVVLHDFFLGDIVAHREDPLGERNVWTEALYNSHGYEAVAERFAAKDRRAAIWKYPVSLTVLQSATGVIVHSDFSLQLARQWFGAVSSDWVTIPHLRAAPRAVDRDVCRRDLGLRPDDYVVCSFGGLGPHKGSYQLFEAWLASRLAIDSSCQLIFVGRNPETAYNRAIINHIKASGIRDRVRITGFAPRVEYCKWLAAADLAVQLRNESRGETSGAVLDCMIHGVPTIVNRHGSLAELPADTVFMLADAFSVEDLTQALELSRGDLARRQERARRARQMVEEIHSPRKVASQYFEAIEGFHEKAQRGRSGLIASIASMASEVANERDWHDAASSISQSLPLPTPKPQLLVDISALVEISLGTGIQRVVRNILKHLLDHPPEGFRVEPVYATLETTYRYARRFTLRFLGCPGDALNDDLVEVGEQDIFLGLDLHPYLVKVHAPTLMRMRECGIKVYFVVYDLLWTSMPQCFPDRAVADLDQWLEVVISSDGAICISKTVAHELHRYLRARPWKKSRVFNIGTFQLGFDGLTKSIEALGSNLALDDAGPGRHILMVGTVEPRKGYAQALSAFEELWSQGFEEHLVIVGKEGWMVDQLVESLRAHPQLNRKLFWYPQAGDATLEALYQSADGLLMASEGEGFGLPLIEAAYYNRPILARDIPVFREVAQDHATYFRANNSIELADALRNWIGMLQKGIAPESTELPILNWAQSTEQLLAVIRGNWYRKFKPAESNALTDAAGPHFRKTSSEEASI
jgi:glycosyltransferase involved in cell wall biosynthesis